MRGCYDWLDRKRDGNQWIRDYRQNPGKGDKASLVMDEPTWSWGRNRAEPYYGQEHAAQATLLLGEVGDLDATIAAVHTLMTGTKVGGAAEMIDEAVIATATAVDHVRDLTTVAAVTARRRQGIWKSNHISATPRRQKNENTSARHHMRFR